MSTRLTPLGALLIVAVSSACDEPLGRDGDGGGIEGGAPGTGAAASTSGDQEQGGAPAAGGADALDGGGGQGPSGACASAGPAGDLDIMVASGADERRALVHVPEGAQERPAALIIALHGFTEGPEAMRDMTHLDEMADERGFVVAYPEGKNGSWNGGVCCGLSEWNAVDDVGFIAALIESVSASHCIDPGRVHVTGFSNGGFLAHRVGCELADRVASIGVVAGQQGMPSCEPTRSISVLQIHGSADPVVPFGGSAFLGYPSTASTIEGWAERDACGTTTSVTYDEGDTLCEARTSCDAGAIVELCTVEGGSHDWFGGGSAWTSGPPQGFVATLKILGFFEAHPMP